MRCRIDLLLLACSSLAGGSLGCTEAPAGPGDSPPGDVGRAELGSSVDGGSQPAQPECLEDEDCPAERPRCLGLSRRCACSSDPDCSSGARCVLPEGYCQRDPVECRVHSDCLGSMLCSSDGLCVVCLQDEDCSAGHVCETPGRCVERARCSEDGACPEGSFCDRLRGACLPEVSCQDSAQCVEGSFCDGLAGRCYPARQQAPLCARCGSDGQCAGEGSRCVPLARGSADAEGAQQLVCARVCETDRECPIGYTCTRNEQGDRLCRAGGAEDSLSCAEIRTVGRPCEADGECGIGEGWCRAERCVYGCEEAELGLRFCTEGFGCTPIEDAPVPAWQRACLAP